MKTSICLRILSGVCLLSLSAATASQNAVTTDPVAVYAGPDDSYPMVAQLDADSPVQVMGCLDDWSWCDVAFADNRGWVYAPDIAYDYDGGYVPFYTYAPSFGVPVVQFTISSYWDRYYHGRPWYAQREEWIHREPPRHHSPAGPRPSAGPPPRSARVDRPPRDARREQSLRLGGADGNAERTRPEEEGRDMARGPGYARPRDDARARDARAPDVRAPDVRAPDARAPGHVEAPHHEERPPAHVEPPRPEGRAIPPHPAEGARHEETRRPERSGERPNDTPHS
ncbi:MAG: SH3 domain-containing protein [Steroidobacteraceae bacterium]